MTTVELEIAEYIYKYIQEDDKIIMLVMVDGVGVCPPPPPLPNLCLYIYKISGEEEERKKERGDRIETKQKNYARRTRDKTKQIVELKE